MNNRNSVSFSLAILSVAALVSGSTATMSYAATQTLPSCTDPTGHNLPCMMVISTLPPPTNALQCQETSGQILPCSYTTQNLINGEQIVVITVYVPANFVFTFPTVIKVVVHETKTKIIREIIREDEPSPICKGIQGVHGCIIFMPGGPGQSPLPIYLTPLPKWCHSAGCRTGWFDGNTGSDPYNPFKPGSPDWAAYNFAYGQGADHSTPYTNCEHFDTCGDPKYDPTHDPKYKPQSQPTSCIVGGVDNCSATVTSLLLVPGLLGPLNINNSKGGGATTPTNVSIPGPQPPMNVSGSTSAKHGGSKINYNNLTKQGLLPPPPQIATCPDGSQPDSSGKCPTTQSSSPPPSSNNNNPPSNNPPPSGGSSKSNGGGGGNGNNGNGGSSSKSSSPSQPTTIS